MDGGAWQATVKCMYWDCKESYMTEQLHFEAYKGGVICISEVTDISLRNLDSSLCFILLSFSHDVHCIYDK